MFKPAINVSIEFYPGESVYATRELPEPIVYEAFQSLDHPTPDADPSLATLCCTDIVIRKRVMKERREISKLISQELTEVLIDQMGAKDTEMGYKKEE